MACFNVLKSMGSKHLITTDIFKAKDPDTPSRQLVYNILKTDSGHFENKQAPGVRISTFTQEDVENQKILFLHRNNMLNDSYISLQVSDGIGTSPSYNLRVTVTPQYWRLENNTGLVLLHQSFGLITPNNLSFTSNVANGDYKAQFRIMKKPNFGVIEVERNANNWKISEIFTTSDLNQHRVRYRHITSKPDFDEFQFQATVEKSTMYTFRITFVKCSLFEITTKPIFMNETQEIPISPQYLSFQTKPLRTLTTSIYYMIAKPPKYGVLLSSVSKYVLKRCDVFTQEDILSLNIKYKLHQKSYSYVQDTFTYVIYSPGCNNITRNMTVIYYPSLDTKSKVGAVLQPLQVEEGSSQNINLEHLNLKTNFVKNLIFNVTQLPIHGILKLVKEGVELNGTDSFTLRDLANNQLFYVHDDSETNQDLFKFLALSPTDDFQFVGEFNFNIIMKNDNSPVRKIEKVFHIVVGGERLLTGDDLRYSDEDIGTKNSDIVYTCRESPNGYFVNIKDKTGKITDFTQQDLDNHQIIFKHKGAEFGKVRLWVTDGQFHVNGILEVQASAPFIHIQMNRKVIVEYGKTIAITKEHLFYSTNLYANDSDIVYEIISKPSFGKIISQSMEVLSNFTQEDINQGHVSYINDITSANGDEIRIRARCKDAISVAQMGIWMLPSIYWEPFTDKGSKSLQVEESTSSIITKKILEISQINVPSSSITYYISDLPLNGYLTILSNSNNTENDPVNVLSFTQDLINDKRVLYIQSGANQTFDKITFNVTNGIIWYNDVKLRIEIIPERLYLGSKNLLVEEGGHSVITTSNLFILTEYYKRKITDYVILQDASHGCIQVHKRCNKFSGFSQKELLAGVISYSHDGSENSTDEITVVAVAGQKRSIPVTLMFNITPVNDQLPKLINNTGLVMWEGGYSVITNYMLGATDEDRPKETLAYQVLGSWWGNVVLTSDINTPVTHFTQEIIDKGMVAFHHENGSEAKFKFNISDGSHKTGDYYFLIKTKPVVLKLTVKPLHIFPLQRKYLTTSHLQASLPDVNRTIHYDVIVPPTLGRLMMESSTSGVFKVVSTFTQTDLNNTKLFYEHTHQFSDLYANDSFIFNVKSHLAAPLLNQVLKIDISVSSGGLDSYINIPKITVDEGGITSIRLNLSEVVEFLEHHSGLHAPIIHASSSIPQHGQIYLKENNNLTIFTQQQMESGSVYYEHDHSDSLGDNIHFSLYLIPHYIRLCNITIPVIVNPINDQPFHLVTPAPNLVVVQGENHTITRNELATEDADTPPSKLKYDLITGPSQGNLILLPDIVPITYFTQEDIDQNKLVYVHNSSILKDSFHFRVWDDKFRPQFTVFNIIVIQINLNISPGLPLHLQQGSDVVFLSENQFFIETNADKHKIKYTLKREPKHGVLYVRNIPSLSFTQTDLINESVMFLQSDMTTANDSFKIQGEILSANTSISNEIEIFIKVQPLMQIKNFTAITGEYNKITLHVLDASPLAKLTNSNPRYTILKLPQHGKVKKVIRSSGEKRNVVDSVITSFTHEEVQSGLIYLVVEDVEVPWFGIQEKLVFMLAATIFQPAIGELKINLKYSIHNDIHSTLAGPNDPAGHEGGYHVASPNMTRDYFLIVSMVVGVVILGVAVIVIIKCRSFEPEELNKEEQCLQPIPLPRPPDRLMSSSPRLKHHIDEFSPQLPTLPQCKITPLSRSDLDSQVCYPYGVEEQPDDWSSCDASEPPCPSKNVMLRRNQYWV